MSEVRFRRSAQADVQKAFEYFEAKSPGLGVEFIERVEEAASKISRNPETYQTIFQDVRAPASGSSNTRCSTESRKTARS